MTLSRLTPARDRGVDGLLELVANGRGRVVVDRFAVHVPRPPAVVHQHDGGAALRDDAREILVVVQRADVVDDRRAARDGLPRDDSLVGVDRDERPAGEGLEDRQHAPQLLAGVDRLGAGTCRLAADVEHVGAVLEHLPAGVDGPCGIEAAGRRRRRSQE